MSLKLSAVPCALLLAACASPALAQSIADEPITLDSTIVTAMRNPEDPPVVAEARARLARTPGAVSVVAAETYENRNVQGLYDILRDAHGLQSALKTLCVIVPVAQQPLHLG
ncbi:MULTISPECIES: hypothetical protein [Brevundimonas]|uniref:hypothetical protein n=1 Tax=Brevundimonas TaxID=41275 RepID=UPI0032096407